MIANDFKTSEIHKAKRRLLETKLVRATAQSLRIIIQNRNAYLEVFPSSVSVVLNFVVFVYQIFTYYITLVQLSYVAYLVYHT